MRSWLLLLIALFALVAAPADAPGQASAEPASAEPASAEPASAEPASAEPGGEPPPVVQSARRGPEAKEPYQWRLMIFGAAVILAMLAFVIWLVRRQSRH